MPDDEPIASRTPAALASGPGALDAAGGREFRFVLPFGSLAFIGALGSLLCCYLVILVGLFLGLEAVDSTSFINPHLQAVIMWGLALVAVFALWRDRAHHASNLPVALGALATAVLIGTLYISYDNRVELMAYVLLVISALLNQNTFLGTLNRKVASQAEEITGLNRSLTERVERQHEEIGRLAQLKRFLAPQVAELVVSEGNEQLLESHRRYIACLFCDLRNFTALAETIEPEEVMAILKAYHQSVDSLAARHGGTIGFRSGDGVMVFFNDPVACDEPVLEAVRAALRIRTSFEEIRAPWTRLGHDIGLGLGIASGYATLGLVGFEGRADYTAIGAVVNLASRLCDQAGHGQILIDPRAFVDVEHTLEAESLGTTELKGVKSPIEMRAIAALKAPA